ncbi:Pup--protein ligase [Bifidobacterium avesanii]|uniref:Pup--protein ligase n=1 Tax=Bifidobacterium avesanii TaxID=1798157 RepID=A0A7K3TEX0_9BIFI|nr:Pup--protein ligase [Bifidobacterium avesanii]KAB8295631.1 Pup--protein ligase [Bifidobacterium avesanii]NEG77635.1 Pup--protein ligase [Bifidobacterium avesanii]
MPQLRVERNDAGERSGGHEHDHDFSRIFGVETEYGVSVTGTEQPCDAGQVAMMMFQPVVSRARSTNTYLANGSRLYLDVGSHPEYATAEARTPMDALAQDAAGERIMARLALDAQERLRRTHGEHAAVHVFKNNVDSSGHTFGCHENYLVRRSVSLKTIERELIPFLVTRPLFSGAGRWTPDGFEITQRADFLDDAVSSATTRSRPMVNTRDEPHADPDRFRRLHVIIGDSNRSQAATWMKLATTHLVLCVIEEHQRRGGISPFASCALADPGAAIRTVSRDVTGSAPLALADDVPVERERTALDIQRVYLAAAQRFVADHADDMDAILPDAAQALELWEQALDAIAAGDWESLAGWVDWAAKLRLFNAMRRRHPDLDPARLAQLDLEYHDVANGGLFGSLTAHHAMRELLSADTVRRAMTEPPADTRAALRGAFVAKALETGAQWSCDWTHATLMLPVRADCELLDPFSPEPTDEWRRVMALMG